MNTDLENEMTLKSYLLGDLNPEEQLRLEQRLMTESAVFEDLHRVEDELIDEYLEGGLSARDKKKFEDFFLSAPERKRKLSFAISLKRYVAEHKPKKVYRAFWPKAGMALWPARSPILKWALAASFLLLIGGGSWSTLQVSNLRTALDREQAAVSMSQSRLEEVQNQNLKLSASLEQEFARRGQLEQEIADLKKIRKTGSSLLPGQTQPALFTAILDPRRSRSSGDMKEITVPSGKGLVKLDLKMEPLKYPRYQVKLQRVEGDEIRNQTESSIEGRFSGLYVPAELLKSGDYVLTLNGITDTGEVEDIDDYYFRVKQQ